MSGAAQRRSPQQISALMRSVRSRDTAPEIAFRRALWAQGLRFRLYSKNLPGKPDIVLPARRLAIFIDGDFWHGGQWRRRSLTSLEEQFESTKSRDYWLSKIRRNAERDCRATAELLFGGWRILRFWESDIRNNLDGCVCLTLQTALDSGQAPAVSAIPQKSFAEFFAGIGLMRVGLEGQGWSVRYANDLDQRKYEMYRAQFPDAERHFHVGDIHEVSAESVPAVTLATASFPCNDLSLAGSRGGLEGAQSSAFWGFVRILRDMGNRRPPLLLIENVPGFLTSAGGRDLRAALAALNELGYAVDVFVVDALHFVPQSRVRLFIAGVLGEAGESPELLSESATRPRLLLDFMQRHPEIRWNVRGLPKLPERTSTLSEILENLPPQSPCWWNRERTAYLLDQMSGRHRLLLERMRSHTRWSYGTVFRRIRHGKSMAELRFDGIAGCLRTPRGGSGRQILIKAGKGEVFARLLTPRECARLMGAGDFQITAPPNQALFGFGDAVCAPVIEWIAKHYLNPVVTELLRGRPLAATYN